MLSPQLQLFLLRWHGVYRGVEAIWLRWATLDGELLLTGYERAEQESQRAEQESQRAKQESQRAEQESQRAEQESQRAEQAEQLLLTAQQRIAELEARLAMTSQNAAPP
jgi:hypothetical protein